MRTAVFSSILALTVFGCGSSTETPPTQNNGGDAGVDTGSGSQPDADLGPNTGDKLLPCSAPGSTLTKMTFRASDGAGGAYAVPVDQDNPYTCWVFDSGPTDLHVTDWAPLIDNTTVVHHVVLFTEALTGSGAPPFGGQQGPIDCKNHMPLQAFGFGWAPGGQNYSFPSDVEQIIPAHTQMVMQVHYNTGVAAGKPENDTSGLALCNTTEDRPKHAGVLLVGNLNISLPPHSTADEVQATCPPPTWAAAGVTSIPGDFDVLGVFPHMHTRGTKIRTDLIRGGSPVDTLGDIEEWSFNNQGFHTFDAPKHVKAGDTMQTHCFYDNPTDQTITWGENTENEMCFNFMYTVPDLREAWANKRANMCVQQ